MLKDLQTYLPSLSKDRTYFEPFLGGGALFFHLLPKRAKLFDINEELINCYRLVRDRCSQVGTIIREHRRQHCREYYYAVRESLPLDDIERAARFIYLNRTCFNGLYRVNSKGEFNVPIGRYKDPLKQVESLIHSASQSLQGVELQVCTYEKVLDHAEQDDFVYFDPPYQPVSQTSSFTSYSKEKFDKEDQRRLSEVFKDLDSRGVKLMLSNSDHPLIREIYDPLCKRMIPLRVGRTINSKTSRRGAVGELLILNY